MHIPINLFTSGTKQRLPFAACFRGLFGISLMVLLSLVQNATASDDIDNTKTLNMTNVDRLRMQLFTNYDKNSYPTYHGQLSNVTIGLAVNYVDIDELTNKMTLHAWLRVRWMDDNRSWNTQEYDNITQIHLKPRDVWKPDVTLFNGAGEGSSYLVDTQIILGHEGSLLWVPPAVYTTFCNLNLRLWPYDTQTCTVKVGTWKVAHIDPSYLDLKESLDYSELVQSTEWDIIDLDAHYNNRDFSNYISYTFVLQRRSSMYAAVIFTPASCIIVLTLSTFWLPPQMGEKLMLNGIIVVVIATFLMYFAQLLPILAENTPLIVLFYSSSLLLVSISTIIAVIVLFLATAKHKRRMPNFLRSLLNGHLGTVLLLNNFTLEAEPQSMLNNGTKELSENAYENPDLTDPLGVAASTAPSSRSIQFDWILLATAIDRICFLLYCLIFIIFAIKYSV